MIKQKFNASKYKSKLTTKKVLKGVKEFGKSFVEPVFKPGSITERTEYQKALSLPSKISQGFKKYVVALPSIIYQPAKAATKKFQTLTNPNAAENFKQFGIRNIDKFISEAEKHVSNSNKYKLRLEGLNVEKEMHAEVNNKTKKNIKNLIKRNLYKKKLANARIANLTGKMSRGTLSSNIKPINTPTPTLVETLKQFKSNSSSVNTV